MLTAAVLIGVKLCADCKEQGVQVAADLRAWRDLMSSAIEALEKLAG